MVIMLCHSFDKVSFMVQLVLLPLDECAKSSQAQVGWSSGLWWFYYAEFSTALTVLISNIPVTQLNAHQWQVW